MNARRVTATLLAVVAFAVAAGVADASPKRDGESTRELVKALPQPWRVP